MRLVVTGGAGFIGSNFVRHMLRRYRDIEVVNFDKLTYAGNLENLRDVERDPRYSFVRGDICDATAVSRALQLADAVVNFAAETHVDRSIASPQDFIRTDVLGTHTLLEAVREQGVARYVQISTDEVYGSVAAGAFAEDSPLRPSSPYAASKAAGDLVVQSFYRTYGTPVVVTRSSNNYGPWQYPEKIIPLFITNAIDDQALPMYGDGLNVRDWLHVEDNCAAIDLVLHRGEVGEVYNIGGGQEATNLAVTEAILARLHKDRGLIRFVADRPGHDRRYAVTCDKLKALGWTPSVAFAEGLARTVDWYIAHSEWWRRIKSGEWRAYYARHYAELEEPRT
ncbi:MAG: dTDP-glucose 4,6-dehydratase [Thermoleophilia bacterium]